MYVCNPFSASYVSILCCHYVIKELVHAFRCAMCVYRVMDALRKFGKPTPRATLTLFSCSPNFLHASITRYIHAEHEPILNDSIMGTFTVQS